MSKNAQANWDDVRFVVAVADHGSVAAAARSLGVNHATVLRRIQAFEVRQGLRVFDKTRRGYQVSADRRGLIEAMREAAASLGQVEQMIEAERPNLQGGVRVTTTDSFAQALLPMAIARVSRELNLEIDLIASNAHLDLGRVQAHVTVRPAPTLPSDLEGEMAGVFRFAVYSTKDGGDAWLGLSGAPARSIAGEWLRRQSGSANLRADSFVSLAALASAGAGKALLPMILGDSWPGLQRLSIPDDLPETPIWVASHVDYARSGRLRRVRKHLAEEIVLKVQALTGTGAKASKPATTSGLNIA